MRGGDREHKVHARQDGVLTVYGDENLAGVEDTLASWQGDHRSGHSAFRSAFIVSLLWTLAWDLLRTYLRPTPAPSAPPQAPERPQAPAQPLLRLTDSGWEWTREI